MKTFVCAGACVTGDCDCMASDDIVLTSVSAEFGRMPPLHEGCTCYTVGETFEELYDRIMVDVKTRHQEKLKRHLLRLLDQKERYMPYYTRSTARLIWNLIRTDTNFFMAITIWFGFSPWELNAEKRLNIINSILDFEDGIKSNEGKT